MRSRRIRPAFASGNELPISTLNTTPLIDVMLVLLIMFIITIPVMTHSVKMDLPNVPPPDAVAEPPVHRLDLSAAGALSWDGVPIARAALPTRLDALADSDQNPVLHFRADGEARYEDFDEVLAMVKRARIERLAMIGNEGHALAIER
jgi:biopolymer transport protein ExbD